MESRTVNGVELSFVDRGTGPPLMLVHGFPLDHTMWDAQIDALAPKYRVIAPDLRGFGRSGVTDAVVTMEQFADDLAGLLDALGIGEPIALGGLSMGGYVAFEFQRKFGPWLRGLMLCDTRATNDSAEMAAARREMAARVLREGPAPLVDAMTPKLFAEATGKERPEVVEAVRRVMMETDPKGIAAAGRGMAERPDAAPMLPRIDCPTLVLVGQGDALSTPDEMRTMARAIPGARFVEIPGAGHLSPMENPHAVSAALREFLDAAWAA
jgi:3-oxoadipate enol-lactonase